MSQRSDAMDRRLPALPIGRLSDLTLRNLGLARTVHFRTGPWVPLDPDGSRVVRVGAASTSGLLARRFAPAPTSDASEAAPVSVASGAACPTDASAAPRPHSPEPALFADLPGAWSARTPRASALAGTDTSSQPTPGRTVVLARATRRGTSASPHPPSLRRRAARRGAEQP